MQELPNLPVMQTKPAKQNLPKKNKLNSANQFYKTKPANPNLPNQTKPNIADQIYQTKPTN